MMYLSNPTVKHLLDQIFLSPDAWWTRLFWNRLLRSFTIRVVAHLPVFRGRVTLCSRGGSCYSCNPRAVAEYLLAHQTEYPMLEPLFLLDHPERYSHILPAGLRTYPLQYGSLCYYYLCATSQFYVTNLVINWQLPPLRPCPQQYFISTGHGGHGIKMIGLDEDHYNVERIRQIGAATSLTLSDSDFFTKVLRRAFAVSGEVLQQGFPRNDVFYSAPAHLAQLRASVLHHLGLSPEARYLIYAPTFRRDKTDFSVYGFDPDLVVDALTRRFGGEKKWYILVSSHPYMLSYYRQIYDFSHPRLIDVGQLPDVQDLLLVGDVLVTDYSSIEMDFSLMGRPVFQLVKDWHSYERGTYFDLTTLPFPFAETQEQLCHNILHFDANRYAADLDHFNREVIHLTERGHASQALADWMKAHVEA